jgi:hypothetical protein
LAVDVCIVRRREVSRHLQFAFWIQVPVQYRPLGPV